MIPERNTRYGAGSIPVMKLEAVRDGRYKADRGPLLTEDQLGEAPIRHGDSVIIANEVAVWIGFHEEFMTANRVEPRILRPSFSVTGRRGFLIVTEMELP